jgi:hypothetical protein
MGRGIYKPVTAKDVQNWHFGAMWFMIALLTANSIFLLVKEVDRDSPDEQAIAVKAYDHALDNVADSLNVTNPFKISKVGQRFNVNATQLTQLELVIDAMILEFIEELNTTSLIGPAGPAGPAGATGATGATGPAGPSGTATFTGIAATSNAQQTFAGSASTTVLFDEVVHDSGSTWNTGTGVFTAPDDGVYLITLTLGTLTVGSDTTATVELATAANTILQQRRSTLPTGERLTNTNVFVHQMAAGEQIKIAVSTLWTITLNDWGVSSTRSSLLIQKIVAL